MKEVIGILSQKITWVSIGLEMVDEEVGGEMAHLIKCLLRACEDLSLDPQVPH